MQKIKNLKLVLNYARAEYQLLDENEDVDRSCEIVMGLCVFVDDDPVRFFFSPEIMVFRDTTYQAFQKMVENMLEVINQS